MFQPPFNLVLLLCAKSFSSLSQCRFRLLAKTANVRKRLFCGTSSKMGRKRNAYQLPAVLGIPVDITDKYKLQDRSCNGVT